jgi:transglutaminase-like putative cysteine protease
MKHGLPDLETAISTVDLLAHHGIDWSRVRHSTYLIHQHMHYEYPGPINDLQQHLMILPPQRYGGQCLLDHRLTVTSPTVETVYQEDSFGNTEITLSVPYVERTIDFEAWILVERCAKQEAIQLPHDPLISERFLQPSPLTQPDDALHQAAAMLKARGQHGLALAQQINEWVYQGMYYTHDATTIRTTAAQALALKQGVCQDYAHIMLVLCRLCAIPARYVSGHLLGEGGTHAWVEVIVPAEDQPGTLLAVALDPTHGRQANMGYITIASGRDYFDVAPTSGTFRAAYSGQLSVRKTVGLTTYEYADTIKLDAAHKPARTLPLSDEISTQEESDEVA